MNTPDKLNPKSTECRQCGTCCIKGGPSFHFEDRDLLEKGVIPLKHLYTIRMGELAYDNVKGRLEPIQSEIIKIKGDGNSWTCVFYENKDKKCRIYKNRPIECRLLKCWDTQDIENAYLKTRITRKELLFGTGELLELVMDHEERCSFSEIGQLFEKYKQNKQAEIMECIVDIVNYDLQLRNTVVEQGGIDFEMLDFLFGRPLTQTIKMFDIYVEKRGDKFCLKPKTSVNF